MARLLGKHPPESRLAAEYDPMARKEDVGIDVDMSVDSVADATAHDGDKTNAPFGDTDSKGFPGATGEG